MSSKNSSWGGRFTESTDEFVQKFTASVDFDQRFYREDIEGSKAHSLMLQKIGLLTKQEVKEIHQGLDEIAVEIEQGKFEWSIALEDVHMNIEARLTDKIGLTGKKLHTGRSRNDQVATDIRLYMKSQIDLILEEMKSLLKGLIQLAEKNTDTIMPGFTHLQIAQPITFGHHIMAWYEMLYRDALRFQDTKERMDYSPLGAAALAGTTYPIDRFYTAKLLNFKAPTENSLDSVSDRDFAIEFCSAASILMMHFSRISEELVLWSSSQFNFIQLPDRFCTGSSIMPQKKNPDVPELIRGKTGRVYGHLMSLLTLMKSQPLAYNKDNQEDKEPLFDTIDTVLGSVHSFANMMPFIEAKKDNMYNSAKQGFSTATDLADYLVNLDIPFREAHEIVGIAVQTAIQKNCGLEDLDLNVLQGINAKIGDDVFDYLTLEGSVNSRNHIGGTAPKQVKLAIERAKTRLDNL